MGNESETARRLIEKVKNSDSDRLVLRLGVFLWEMSQKQPVALLKMLKLDDSGTAATLVHNSAL